jgi:hypothetical protein
MKKLITVLMCLSFILTPVVPAQASGGGDKPGGGAFYANQILSIGTAAIGSNILLNCKLGSLVPSLQIFMAGSLVYIASEFMGASAQKAFLKANSEEIDKLKATMKEGGDLQRGIIEAKLKEEKDKLGFVNKRKTWMMAITAIYTAAAVAAYMEIAALATCTATIAGPMVVCPQLVSAMCTGEGVVATAGIAKALALAYSFAAGNSGGGAISTYGSMAIALGLMVTSLGSTVVVLYQTPFTRSITFGAAAALSLGVVAGLSSTASKLEDNVKKLETLLADFKTKTHDENGAMPGAEETDYNDESKRKYELKALPKGQEVAKSCWGRSGKGMEYSEGACKNSVKLKRPDFKFGMELPTLKAVGNSATDLAQAVSDGDTGRADLEAGKLAANAMRMKEIKENIEKQMNEQRKARGEKPIDFKAEENRRIASMMSGFNKQAAASNTGVAALDAKATLDPEPTVEASTAAPVVEEKTAAAPTATPMDFNFDEGLPAEDLLTEEPTATLTESLEDYETNESDISKKSEVSIFKQLSNRYLLNYTKIFEKKKTVEETPPR